MLLTTKGEKENGEGDEGGRRKSRDAGSGEGGSGRVVNASLMGAVWVLGVVGVLKARGVRARIGSLAYSGKGSKRGSGVLSASWWGRCGWWGWCEWWGRCGCRGSRTAKKVRGAGRGFKEGRDEMLRGGEGGIGGILNASW